MIPENTPRLETADLILRRFTENDLHAVLRLRGIQKEFARMVY